MAFSGKSRYGAAIAASRPSPSSYQREVVAMTTRATQCPHGNDPARCAPFAKTRGGDEHERLSVFEIVQFLNAKQIRATYGAVGDAVGVIARNVGARLGKRRPEVSWVVRTSDGLPSGYQTHEIHPALTRTSEIIRTGSDLVRRVRETR
jgi:hypothetical protein